MKANLGRTASILLIIFFFSAAASALADWNLESSISDLKINNLNLALTIPAPENVGADFKKILAQKEPLLLNDLNFLGKNCAIIFVPGFISETVLAFEDVNPGIPIGGYFAEQIDALKNEDGLDARLFRTESEASVSENAESLAVYLRKFTGRTILIGHSKGGLEILDVLVHYADIRPKVAGWIAIQSPFFGSPIADLTYENKILRVPADWILQALGGSDHSLHDLETKTRRRYFERHEGEIQKVFSEIPHISMVTWVDSALPVNPIAAALDRLKSGAIFKKESYTLYKLTRDFMLLNGTEEHSDGMAPRSSAVLPGGKYVAIEGPDHGAIIGEYGFSVTNRGDRILLVRSLVKLLMEDVRNMKD